MNLTQKPALKNSFPLIQLQGKILFPRTVSLVQVLHPIDKNSVAQAQQKKQLLTAVICKEHPSDNPKKIHFYETATIVQILHVTQNSDGSSRVLLEGISKGEVRKVQKKRDIFYAVVKEDKEKKKNLKTEKEEFSLMRYLEICFKEYLERTRKSDQIFLQLKKADTPEHLIGLAAQNLDLPFEKKLKIFKNNDVRQVLEDLILFLSVENEIQEIKTNINKKVRKNLEKNQRNYVLNEQLKEIHKELGHSEEFASLEKTLEEETYPREVRKKLKVELKRLKSFPSLSPESGIMKTYLEWLSKMPWDRLTEDERNIQTVSLKLHREHYALEKAKDKILDFLASQELSGNPQGSILCFVGPPGTGKTSLGQSVAKALKRKFVRISLGGVRDEAEIRGHRRTYIGAMPGKIVQAVRRVNVINPVILLDEIDKIASEYRGDPVAALLEVLDPEQNTGFTDHYLELPLDLSKVLFITTANSLQTIPYPLLDRMDIVEVSGYSDKEKIHIAREHLLPGLLKKNGLQELDLKVSPKILLDIIKKYTRESGVRELERQLRQLFQRIGRNILLEHSRRPGAYVRNASFYHRDAPYFAVNRTPEDEPISLKGRARHVREEDLETFLGTPPFEEILFDKERVGMALGLAWTEMGGRMIPVEVTEFPGKGRLHLTGKIGEVMKESAQIALSFLKAEHKNFRLSADFMKEKDIHIHVPEGAVPKDGPSAGITLTAALLSCFLKQPLKKGTAMTGEITLTDRLLPIGGLKEKLLAAVRNKMKTVILPAHNKKDFRELASDFPKNIQVLFFESLSQSLHYLFPCQSK